jgi:hypothetical protein
MMPVSLWPGLTPLTTMPNGPSSLASLFVIATTPSLEAT